MIFTQTRVASTVAWLGSLAALPWLTLSSVAYFASVHLLQNRLYAGRDWAAEYGQWFSGFHLRPEPYETALYLLGFLLIPLIAVAARFAWQRQPIRWLTAGIAAVGILAAILRLLPKLPSLAAKADPTVIAAYLQRRGLAHAVWLAVTKRTFLNLVLIVVAVLGTLVAAWWLNATRRTKLQAWWQRQATRRWPAWTPIVVAVALAVVLWHPNFPYEEHHYGYWLGPANDQLGGKQWLVETNSQYGLFSHLSLVGVFALTGGVSYEMFSVLNQLSFLVYFTGLFFLLRQWLRSDAAAIAGLSLLMAATYWLMISPTVTAYDYPGLSPFRFGLYVPALLLWLNYTRKRKNVYRELCLALAGLAPLWNIDSGMYLAAAVGAVAIFDATVWGQGPWPQRIVDAVGRLARLIGYGILGLLAISLGVRLGGGAWPNWSAILAEVATYTSGRALNRLPLVGGFLLFIVGYLAAGLWVARRTLNRMRDADSSVVALIVAYGILSLNYYIGNSAWNLLFPVAGPLVLLWTYFAHQWLMGSGRRWPIAAVGASLAVAAVVWAVKVPVELGHRDYSSGGLPRTADEALLRDADRLLAEYGHLPRIPLVHTRGTKLLIAIGKPNALPIYDLTQLYFLKQMDGVITIARQQPAPIFVSTLADPPDPQVEYFREHALAGYTRIASFETLDAYAPATTTPVR